MYAVTGSGNSPTSDLYTVDVGTAVATMVGDTGLQHVTALDVDPTDGQLYAHKSASPALYTLDASSGSPTLRGGGDCNIPDMSFRSDGTLFGFCADDAELVTIDLSNGSLASIGSTVAASRAGLAFGNDGTLYLKDNTNLYTIDPSDGSTIALLGSITGACSTSTPHNILAVDPDTGTLYTVERESGDSRLCSIDLGTLVSTQIGMMGAANVVAVAFAPGDGDPDPEPTEVWVDLRPGENPNCVNPGSNGKLPVAVFGAADFDVTTIDAASLDFGGAAPTKCKVADVEMEGPAGVFTVDAHPDLICHFPTQDISLPAPGSDCDAVILEGSLLDATEIVGGDIACLPPEPTCATGTPVPLD